MKDKKLSDIDGIDLAHALFIAAIDSKKHKTEADQLKALEVNAKTIFEGFDIDIQDHEIEVIKEELRSMLDIAKESGLMAQLQLSMHQKDAAKGIILEEVGKRKQSYRSIPITDTMAIYLSGPIDVLEQIATRFLTVLESMIGKINASGKVFGKDVRLHISLPEKKVVLAGMIKKINASREEHKKDQDKGIQRTDGSVLPTRPKISTEGRGMKYAERIAGDREAAKKRGATKGK